ncbi:hypothetical protein SLV14_000585 [Streptomyces sp. Je 1-4]|uniref:hypothetical protein n=1 Tax=Streptomyces TaxID=1883 RepID=UPI00140EECBC|nr:MULTISPECIES: hypothetical protein [unclassified Streptomyces]QIK05057.1 hypothetical protein G7Z12_02375 [Streptomyces sp. ID38640]UYB38239.1 hypothetical protein SLV14_000585 [Streptomyces sp. Je 1-4]UZQ34185.1 hypothetical protein SLV14N_000585 [Streptomyces sp. Je 1-4] [Streptomyces sp. Je 1-4 4N24]UZQ41603.1 hypothetical protein SLV14NA_000585 [Streptomyces sp. Je 1-4] [Streptomyces sp. Je 1-4 4N24_ara]
MKSSRLRRRLIGAAATAVLAGTGVLVAAPAAVAKANLLAIDKVALHEPGLQVKVTYSCDTGIDHQLVANAEKANPVGHDYSSAAGTLKKDKLVCDYADHTARVTMRPAAGSHFAKGEKVKVTVFYFDNDGFSYAHQETVSVL